MFSSDTPARPLIDQENSHKTRVRLAVASFLSAVVIPPAAILVVARILLPGDPLAPGIPLVWATIFLAGIAASTLVYAFRSLSLLAGLAIGAAIGTLAIGALTVALNIWPRIGTAL